MGLFHCSPASPHLAPEFHYGIVTAKITSRRCYMALAYAKIPFQGPYIRRSFDPYYCIFPFLMPSHRFRLVSKAKPLQITMQRLLKQLLYLHRQGLLYSQQYCVLLNSQQCEILSPSSFHSDLACFVLLGVTTVELQKGLIYLECAAVRILR